MKGFTTISVVKDMTESIKKSLNELAKKTVCVGIPEEKNVQHVTEDIHESITNAQLAFLMTNGVRSKSMREAMQHDLDSSIPYSKAHEMYIHEHGSALWHVPPRPIIEPAINDDKEVIAEFLKEAIKAAMDGNMELAKEYLNKSGLEGQGAAQDWFDNPQNKWPPNAERTIKAKGSDKPLIDTGELRKAITYIIKEG